MDSYDYSIYAICAEQLKCVIMKIQITLESFSQKSTSFNQILKEFLLKKRKKKILIPCRTRRFSNHKSRLLSRAHTFAIIVILDLKIHQSLWIHWSFFPKTWTKGHWPLHDLWPHVCWGHMCDSTQGSLCPSPMTIHQCMWIQWSIWQITTYIWHTTYIHTTYRMSDHIVSYWTQFRRDKKVTHSYTNRPDFGQNFDKVTSPPFFFIYCFLFFKFS